MFRTRVNSQNIDIAKFKCITYFTCYLKKITLVLVIFRTKTVISFRFLIQVSQSSERKISNGYQDTEISSARVRSEFEGITEDAHKHWTDVTFLYLNLKMCILSLTFSFAHHISNILMLLEQDMYMIGVYLKHRANDLKLI